MKRKEPRLQMQAGLVGSEKRLKVKLTVAAATAAVTSAEDRAERAIFAHAVCKRCDDGPSAAR